MIKSADSSQWKLNKAVVSDTALPDCKDILNFVTNAGNNRTTGCNIPTNIDGLFGFALQIQSIAGIGVADTIKFTINSQLYYSNLQTKTCTSANVSELVFTKLAWRGNGVRDAVYGWYLLVNTNVPSGWPDSLWLVSVTSTTDSYFAMKKQNYFA